MSSSISLLAALMLLTSVVSMPPATLTTGSGSLGVNLHGPATSAEIQCLQTTNGFNYVDLPLANLSSTTGANADVFFTISNALQAGVGKIDGYIDLCPQTWPIEKVPAYMQAVLDNAKQNLPAGIISTYLLDVESQPASPSNSTEACWFQDVQANIAYIEKAGSVLDANNVASGFWTNQANWTAITGPNYSYKNGSARLAWAFLDGDASFSEFVPFGGWAAPTEKHFHSDTVCDILISYVYAEDYFCAREEAVCADNLMACCQTPNAQVCTNGMCSKI